MRKIFIFFGIIILAFTFAACEQTQKYTIDQVIESIDIEYADGETADRLESSIILPSTSNLIDSAKITWVSSNPNVLFNDGTVIRPVGKDEDVILTLYVRIGLESRAKTFELTILKEIIYYTVTFELSDSEEPLTFEVIEGENVEEPENPIREGYDFLGWSSNQHGMTMFYFGDPIHDDITLYAIWLQKDQYAYEGYYEGADGLVGYELITFLRSVVSAGFVSVNYGDARYILDDSDQDPNNSNNVILVYRGTSVSGVWDSGATWNREHVWPQSLLGVSVSNSSRNVGSDLHNLKPANPSENSSRSNKYFDILTTSASYEPRDEVKGDVARILFYMTIKYDYLQLVDSNPNLYEMGKLETLLQWHLQDPVDDFERNRNEVIFSHQNNRNPFIDHPEFVEKIWGPITLSSGETIILDFTQITRVITIDVYIIELNKVKKENYIV